MRFSRLLNIFGRRPRASRGKRRAPLGARRARIEMLEARAMLDASGAVWGTPPQLTLSFAPDGTDIAGAPSELFATFDAIAAREAWQETILRALQTWAVHTNADVGVVADGGQPFGAAGPTRGDTRFGDIRVGAIAMDPAVAAISIPSDGAVGGTWVGDVLFNTDAGLQNLDDLFSVALHEAGHVFGLGHSSDPLSPMFVHGVSSNTDLTAGDIADLQALYGVRAPDLNESSGNGGGGANNDSFQDATELRVPEVGQVRDGSAPAIVYGDLESGLDTDFFVVDTPDGYSGSVTFQLRSQGISLLAPQLTVYSSEKVVIGSVASTAAGGDTVSFQVAPAQLDNKFFVQVDAAQSGLYATGGYSLVVTFDAKLTVDPSQIDAVAGGQYRFLDREELERFFAGDSSDSEEGDEDSPPLFGDDQHADDTPFVATELETGEGFVEGSRYQVVASISDASDADYYKFKSPEVVDGPSDVMTVFVRSIDSGRLVPRVTVLDEDGLPLAADLLVNGNGQYTLQVVGNQPDTEYFVRVEAQDPGGLFDRGNYQLTIVFGDRPTDLLTFASGTLSAAQPNNAHALYVAQTQFFHVALDVAPNSNTSPTLVWARVLDENDQEVFRLGSIPGESRTASGLFLTPGTYRVEVNGSTFDGSPLESVAYTLRGTVVSSLLAIDPLDPTDDPFQCPDGSGPFCYPGDVVSSNPYLWDLFLGTLPGPVTLNGFDQVNLLFGDWWSWYWTTETGNAPSVSFNDTYDVGGGGPLSVPAEVGTLANDFDTDGDPILAYVVDDVGQGTLSFNPDGTFVYQPPSPDFSGVVTFTYQVTDFFDQGTNVSTVTLLVHAASDPWVVNRQVFYNSSRYDGGNPAADANDDLAIAPGKRALLPGATASRANYTSFSRGINGIFIDVQGLANPQAIGPDDFAFATGNSNDPAAWTTLGAPVSVSVRPGAGEGGTDRIAIVLADHAVEGEWLRTTVLANADTGLTSPDVFYFGNAVGETANRVTNAVVDSADVSLIAGHQRGPFDPAPIDDPYDINRDGLVNATDIILARDHEADAGQALLLLDAPLGGGGSAAVAATTAADETAHSGPADAEPIQTANAAPSQGADRLPAKAGGPRRPPIASRIDVMGGWAGWSWRPIVADRQATLRRLEKRGTLPIGTGQREGVAATVLARARHAYRRHAQAPTRATGGLPTPEPPRAARARHQLAIAALFEQQTGHRWRRDASRPTAEHSEAELAAIWGDSDLWTRVGLRRSV